MRKAVYEFFNSPTPSPIHLQTHPQMEILLQVDDTHSCRHFPKDQNVRNVNVYGCCRQLAQINETECNWFKYKSTTCHHCRLTVDSRQEWRLQVVEQKGTPTCGGEVWPALLKNGNERVK